MTNNRRNVFNFRAVILFAASLGLLVSSGCPCLARGGGGCIEEGTEILAPGGMIPVERLRPGDRVTALVNGCFRESRVAGCTRILSSEFVELVFSNRTLSLTTEHPVSVGKGTFRTAGCLKAGDEVLVSGKGVSLESIVSVKRIKKTKCAYNLMVMPGGTYVAGNVVVHNKGCFLPDTPILRPDGSTTFIRRLRKYDQVMAFTPDGKLVSAEIRNIIKQTVKEYFTVTTAKVRLNVTGEHPFYVGAGTFKTLESLHIGEKIFAYDGCGLSEQAITGIEKVDVSAIVYNLQTDEPNTFFAGGVAVHNKGCFPAGTMILTASGLRSVQTIKKGDCLTSIRPDGRSVDAIVQKVFVTEAVPRMIRTDSGSFHPTDEHPIALPDGTFLDAGRLMTGQKILAFRDGRRVTASVIRNEPGTEKKDVYNIQVGAPHTFVADGIIVHNKGGCFLPETPVLLADGTSLPIDKIKRGDRVMAFQKDGKVTEAGVQKVLVQLEDEYYAITTEYAALKVTEEHPFYVGEGHFKSASSLCVGEALYGFVGGVLTRQNILSKEKVNETVSVYNLQTDEPNTFFAGGIAVHNKGGCFPAGTIIETADGSRHIEELVPGDRIISPRVDGPVVVTTVESVFMAEAPLVILVTDAGRLATTEEHPVALADGSFLPAGNLSAGETVLVYRGGALCETKVQSVEVTDKSTPVFNLSVGWPHTYVAGGYLVHNKGGGGHSRSGHGSSGSTDDPLPAIIFFVLVLGVIIYGVIADTVRRRRENLDYSYPRSKIDRKAVKTEKLLQFIAKQDQVFDPVSLRKVVEVIFLKLQECWQARLYDEELRQCMMPYLYRQHLNQLNAMKKSHEINKLAGMRVDAIDLVNVRYTTKEERREFTALVTATATDFYIDDRSGEFLRGDEEPAQFQEFWTFQLQNGQWKLREIEQTRESDVLKDENFFEQFTDKQLERVYGETVEKAGPAGPWLKASESERATKIERMLNFLGELDKLWNRQLMLDRARQVFADVYLGRQEAVLPEAVTECLFPDVAEHLAAEMAGMKAKGFSVEYRNFCVRKVEIVIVYNFADNAKDEFCARINAHAQKTVKRGETIVSQDEDVQPIEEYWVFGRLEDQWKLKEVMPAMTAAKISTIENVDEDSSPSQVQWYYTKKRTV